MTTLLVIALLAFGLIEIVGKEKALAYLAAFRTRFPGIQTRQLIGGGMVLLALVLLASQGRQHDPGPTPAPTPAPDSGISLAGKWAPRESTPEDIAVTEAMFAEVADEVEWDSMQAEPLITSGVAFDELRTRAFDMRLRGESIGDRHPEVRAEIKRYLDATAGKSGGQMSPAVKATWIAAFRSVAREAGRGVR